MPIDLNSLRTLLNSSDIGQTNPTLYKILNAILSNDLSGDGQYITNLQSNNLSGNIPENLLETYKYIRNIITEHDYISNSGSSLTVIYDNDLEANLFNATGDLIRGVIFGDWAANANNKSLTINFGGNAILTLGPFAVNGGAFWTEFIVMRVATTTARARTMTITRPVGSTTSIPISNQLADITGISWPTSINLEVTAQGTSTDDIIVKGMNVVYQPMP